jgi:uncharacterized protein (DUF1499 family)
MVKGESNIGRVGTGLAGVTVLLALGAVSLTLLSGPAYRLGLALGSAFGMLRWGAYLGLAGIVGAVLAGGLLLAAGRRGTPLAAACVAGLVAAAAFAVPYSWTKQVERVPPIHDITTDIEEPPAFQAVLPLRADAPNTAEYGGPEVAAQQRSAYPDLRPIDLPVDPETAFVAAREVALSQGWEIVAAEAQEGRIEATDTTFWFGFQDDVVVRIRPRDGGSRVDIRSVSRVGRSDVGANADRIRSFRDALLQRLPS